MHCFRLFLSRARGTDGDFCCKDYIYSLSGFYWVPQVLFWKQHLGRYFVLYEKEHFFWLDPQVINILFSYRKGWITYTPLVALCFAGFFFIRKDLPLSGWIFGLVTVALVYVMSCWWTWFFGGSFGARTFCQYIAPLSVPLASVVEKVFYPARRFILQGLVTLLLVLFVFSAVCLNIGQTYQYVVARRLHYDSMTKELYWDFLRSYHFPDDYEYWGRLDPPDYEKMLSGEDRDR